MDLRTGDEAPDFTGQDQNGNAINLHGYRGKKVILYFYPKDDTPGCTAQACNLRDNYEQLRGVGFEVIGVSTDNGKSHQKFVEKYGLPFPLIADTDQKIVELYGVWREKARYGRKYLGTERTTFLIDESGIITDVIGKVDTRNHTKQILK